jgi:hypothetical protein
LRPELRGTCTAGAAVDAANVGFAVGFGGGAFCGFGGGFTGADFGFTSTAGSGSGFALSGSNIG